MLRRGAKQPGAAAGRLRPDAGFELHPEIPLTLARVTDLDPDTADAAITDRTYLDRIARTRTEARAAGVTGIPTFVIGGRTIVGWQPYEVLAVAIEAAEGEPPRPEGAGRR